MMSARNLKSNRLGWQIKSPCPHNTYGLTVNSIISLESLWLFFCCYCCCCCHFYLYFIFYMTNSYYFANIIFMYNLLNYVGRKWKIRKKRRWRRWRWRQQQQKQFVRTINVYKESLIRQAPFMAFVLVETIARGVEHQIIMKATHTHTTRVCRHNGRKKCVPFFSLHFIHVNVLAKSMCVLMKY